MIYCIGALPEMDHQLGCGICTIIGVLKPAPIVGFTPVHQAVTEISGVHYFVHILYPPKTWKHGLRNFKISALI
jgi:hypothetical protein